MAECHPVGFQWVMEAKARGAKVIHIDPRFTRTSRGRRPARPAAGRQRHRLPRRDHQLHPEQREVLPRLRRRLHQRGDDPAARTSATSTTSTASSPATTRRAARTTPSSWLYEGQDEHAAAGSATSRQGRADPRARARRRAARRPGTSSAATVRRWSTPACTRDETPAAPALRVPGAQAALRPLHPRDGAGDLRRAPGAFLRGVRGRHRQQRPRPDHHAGSTRSAGPSTRSACSTSAARRSSSCCWATWAARAAGSWRCAVTPASRARPTSRRCSTCCPATCRCPRPASTTPCDDYIDSIASTDMKGFWAQRRRLRRQPAQVLLGRRGHRGERLRASTTCHG